MVYNVVSIIQFITNIDKNWTQFALLNLYCLVVSCARFVYFFSVYVRMTTSRGILLCPVLQYQEKRLYIYVLSALCLCIFCFLMLAIKDF